MPRSKTRLYVHLVWATAGREPVLTPEIERALLRCIRQEARRLNCTVLAMGGTPDHIHLVVQFAASVSIACLVQCIKEASSAVVNEQCASEQPFRWDATYGVFSVSHSHVRRVMSYVGGQKRHHRTGRVWEEWEETKAEADAPFL